MPKSNMALEDGDRCWFTREVARNCIEDPNSTTHIAGCNNLNPHQRIRNKWRDISIRHRRPTGINKKGQVL
ncbi:MAG: hypothetical protein V3T42_07095 [Nitrospirales bacterium]